MDDNPEKYTRNYGNLVTVSPYHGSLHDDELCYLHQYLEQLALHPNVRSVEKTILAPPHGNGKRGRSFGWDNEAVGSVRFRLRIQPVNATV